MKNWVIVSILLIATSCGMRRQSALGRHLFVAQKVAIHGDTSNFTLQRKYITDSCIAINGSTQQQKIPQKVTTQIDIHKSQLDQKFDKQKSSLSFLPFPRRKQSEELPIYKISQGASLHRAVDFPIYALICSSLGIPFYLVYFTIALFIEAMMNPMIYLFLMISAIFGAIALVLSIIASKPMRLHESHNSKEASTFWRKRKKIHLAALILAVICFSVVLLIAAGF